MFCLVYTSTASPDFDREKIQLMLEKARVFNNSQGITGCLLSYKGEFLQYLEGNQVKVLALFDKIQKDRRHSDIELISHGTIRSREFTKWDMAYEDFHGDNDTLQFLKLLVSSYLTPSEKALDPNPTSEYFWRTAKRLLAMKATHGYGI
ncbi:MAG: BLUF domain-containing protein [Bacteroidota bacterium]